jgi:hypothetical protein
MDVKGGGVYDHKEEFSAGWMRAADGRRMIVAG